MGEKFVPACFLDLKLEAEAALDEEEMTDLSSSSFDAVTSLHSGRVRTAATRDGELQLNYPKYRPPLMHEKRERNPNWCNG